MKTNKRTFGVIDGDLPDGLDADAKQAQVVLMVLQAAMAGVEGDEARSEQLFTEACAMRRRFGPRSSRTRLRRIR